MKNKTTQKLVDDVLDIFKNNKNVISGTVVGSIINKPFDQISDIDLVVIVKELSLDKIINLKNELLGLSPKVYKLNKTFEVNDSFGPLKKENDENIVFHLMVYDETEHKNHVINSPFTCYDWERSNYFVKKSTKEVYATRNLMFCDFNDARRGTKDYINDIKLNRISYRLYEESKTGLVQKKYFQDLDSKHKIEYSFHIIKNSIGNFIKLFLSRNEILNEEDFANLWKLTLPALYMNFYDAYKQLEIQKIQKKYEDDSLIKVIPSFLDQFNSEIDKQYKNTQKFVFIRHFPTELNDGRLFGQKSDAPILKITETIKTSDNEYKNYNVYSSPLIRCKQTANIFGFNEVNINDNLKEINYGVAEGMFFEKFIQEYPKFKQKIDSNEDFKYPQGESYKEVNERIFKFLDESKNSVLAFTHQGPIRALIGTILKIQISDWYKINIPHGIPLEFIKYNGNYLINVNRRTLSSILKGISG